MPAPHGELGADAPLGGARHGRGRPRPVPGHEARDRPGHRRRLLLRLRAAPAADARRPRRDRGADAREHRRGPPVRAQRAAAGRGARLLRRAATSRSRSRSSTTCRRRPSATARRCRRRLLPSRARSSTCAAARTSRAPARSGRSSCWRSPARTGAATRSARCSSASTARPGRPRRSSTSTCGGASEAKKRDHRKLGAQLDLFSFHDVCPGSAFWHPKGQLIWRTLEGAMRELQARRGYQEVSTPILVVRAAVAAVRPLGPLRRENMFIARVRGPAVQRSSR